MRNLRSVLLLPAVVVAAVLGACSSESRPKQSQKSGSVPDKIQGKVQIMPQSYGSADASLSQGRPVVFLWQGVRRYTLFFRNPVDVVPGKEYAVEGVNAQRVIDGLGDPDLGRNGYPLLSSCERVVRMAWSGLAFDEMDAHASALRVRVKRYPARPVFLVTRIQPAAEPERAGSADRQSDAEPDEDLPVVAVPAEKQRASLISGTTVLTAPLWEPAGGTVLCQVVIDPEGKISELGTGMQLCEAVPWSEFRYKPLLKAGRPVKAKTEVEVIFKPLAVERRE